MAVLGAFALLTGTALAHPERQAFFPDPNKGSVPGHGGHNKKPLIVCKSNSKRLIKKIFKGKKQRGKRLLRLGQYKKCRFRNIQTAVNHAKSNDRIAILPGLYREKPSRKVPVDQPRARRCSRRPTTATRRCRTSSTRSSARTRAT